MDFEKIEFSPIESDPNEKKAFTGPGSHEAELFRRIFVHANQGIWILDENAAIQLVNPRMAEMLGYTQVEMLGRFKWEFVIAEDQDSAREHYEARRKGVSEQFEVRFCRKNGSILPAVMAARPIFEGGRFRGALDFISDNTAFKESQTKLLEIQDDLEQRVAKRTEELRQTVFHLESFSYSIAHDLRAPLRAIVGYTQILQGEHSGDGNSPSGEILGRIKGAALRLDDLIRDVLDYSRVIREKLPVTAVDLSKLVHDMVNDYPEFAQSREHIRIGCEGAMVMGNLARLIQAMSNFLSNALKFVPPGETPRVAITCEKRGEKLRLTVSDKGVGIPPELQPQIWGVFRRLHSAEYPGTGIGLAIVKEAIERMGGTVGVESQPGVGSHFWFELPQAPGAETSGGGQSKPV